MDFDTMLTFVKIDNEQVLKDFFSYFHPLKILQVLPGK